jgi:hypothetical protein
MTTTLASARAAALPALALALLLAGCGGTTSPGTGTGTSPGSSATPDPTTEVTGETSPPEDEDEDEEATPDACGLTEEDYAIIRDGLQTQNFAAIGLYLADSVYVTYASTEYQGSVDNNPGLVLQNLQDVSYPGLTWTFDIPASDLANWADSEYYAADFTDCAIIGITNEDRGVSLTVAGGEITRELITYTIEAWGY